MNRFFYKKRAPFFAKGTHCKCIYFLQKISQSRYSLFFLFFFSFSSTLLDEFKLLWKWPWYENLTVLNKNFKILQVTRDHLIFGECRKNTMRLGRHHLSLLLHWTDKDRRPPINFEPLFFNYRENIITTGDDYNFWFYYTPSLMNFEDRSNYCKKYLCLTNNCLPFNPQEPFREETTPKKNN